MIESEKNRLKFSKMEIDNTELKQLITAKMMQGSKVGSDYPVAIVKSQARNRCIMNAKDFDSEWPGAEANAVM